MYDRTYTMDIRYAPLFVFGMGKLLQSLRKTPLFPLLGKIGSQSMLMWFLHCLFFNVTKELTQPLIYAPRNPILVTLLALTTCYFAAVLIDKPSVFARAGGREPPFEPSDPRYDWLDG